MHRFLLILALLLLKSSASPAQKPLAFRGSFLMSFNETGPKKSWPFAWNVDVSKMSLEVMDDINKKGVSKRILYDLADSSWLMLMEYKNIKQGTRIHANAMFRDTMKTPVVKTKITSEKKIIEGYSCRKY